MKRNTFLKILNEQINKNNIKGMVFIWTNSKCHIKNLQDVKNQDVKNELYDYLKHETIREIYVM